MHIETLKVFCDIIESGSFSYAASQNFVTQSAVSQQVRSLEEKYDCRLIERGRAGVKPTAGRPDSLYLEQGNRAPLPGTGKSPARDRLGGRRLDSRRHGLQRRFARVAAVPDRISAQLSGGQRSSGISALEQNLRRPDRGQSRSRRRCLSGQAQPDRLGAVSPRRTGARGAARQSAGQAHEGERRTVGGPEVCRLRTRHSDPQGLRPNPARARRQADITRWSSTISRRSSARSRSASDARSCRA